MDDQILKQKLAYAGLVDLHKIVSLLTQSRLLLFRLLKKPPNGQSGQSDIDNDADDPECQARLHKLESLTIECCSFLKIIMANKKTWFHKMIFNCLQVQPMFGKILDCI